MAEKKIKRKLLFTGFLKEENRQSGDPHRCYACKRSEGQESLVVDLDDGEIGYVPVHIGVHSIMKDNVELNYPLCEECFFLLSIGVTK